MTEDRGQKTAPAVQSPSQVPNWVLAMAVEAFNPDTEIGAEMVAAAEAELRWREGVGDE